MNKQTSRAFFIYSATLLILIAFASFIRAIGIEKGVDNSGSINFSFAFVLLAAYLSAHLLKNLHLPKISGYILVGIIAGPYISGFLTKEMVSQFQLIDDLALNFIAFSAGGALHLNALNRRKKAIILNIIIQSVIIFLLVCLFSIFTGPFFIFTKSLSTSSLIAFSILMGVIAVARSPSSAMAIISETKASGTFTDTILGVTVAIDVLVIVFFTIALTAVKLIMSGNGVLEIQVFAVLFTEITFSIVAGLVLGKCISLYIEYIGHDLPLFLLFTAFAIAKLVIVASYYTNLHFNIHLSLEPLLTCMSAGFAIQNFSPSGKRFVNTLEDLSLPIYILFFSIAGAALDLEALKVCWPVAVCIVIVRIAGIFISTYIAGTINKDPAIYKKASWMAYLTQAGVAIGLAQIVRSHYPDIGLYLTTVVLAVITINQIIGPITFKVVLGLVGESKADDTT